MAIAQDHTAYQPQRRRHIDGRDYRWVFWLTFPVFLACAAVSRLIPARSEIPNCERQQSVFRQAWVAANSSIPFVYLMRNWRP